VGAAMSAKLLFALIATTDALARVPLDACRLGNAVICSPSVAKANFLRLESEITDVVNGGAPWLHFAVQDGKFSPKISFGTPVIAGLRDAFPDIVFDVKLSVIEPERHIATFAKAGADIISIHPEATLQLGAVLDQIRISGCSAGVVLNPATPVQAIEEVLGLVDVVVVMLVSPGWGGPLHLDIALRKIKEIKDACSARGLPLPYIEVDGGVNNKNVESLIRAGATVIVAGGSVFKSDNKREAILQLTAKFESPIPTAR